METQDSKPLLDFTRQVDGMRERVHVPWGCREQFVLPDFPGGEVLERSRITCIGLSEVIPPYKIDRRNARDHVLLVPLRGGGTFSGVHGSSRLSPGTALILPAHCHYQYWATGPWKVLWLHVRSEDLWGLGGMRTPLILENVDSEALMTFIHQVFLERRLNDQYSDAAIASCLRLVVTQLARIFDCRRGNEAQHHQRLLALWSLVEERLDHRWTVDELAREYGVSRTRLGQIIRKTEGKTPMERVRSLRMNRAQEMLIRGDYTLDAIAHQLGFSTSFALSKTYKKHFGYAPAREPKNQELS
ncbi:MAG: helix-turn-helix transcriptional regulator [Spirochaetales bacterium]|nr:helix-turn-helix transcriptional regulator [Spirochaetales bacterium]